MWEWIKEIVLTILALVALISIIYLLFFKTCSACAQEVPLYEIPIQVDPGSEEVVFIPGNSPTELNLENFYEKSKETGLYPTWGWTGEYYEYGVTHGAVTDEYSPNFARGGFDNIRSINSSGTVVPSPSSGAAGLLLLGFGLMRRRCA